MTNLSQRLQVAARRVIQRVDLEHCSQELTNNQLWMLSEIADDINAMTETGDMMAGEAREVLTRLVGILDK